MPTTPQRERAIKVVEFKQAALAALLREIRERAGITQKQLAERLGWRRTDVSKVEGCVRQMGHIEVRDWVHALGTDMLAFELELQARLESLGIADHSSPGTSSASKATAGQRAP